MVRMTRANLDDVRSFHAKMMFAASNSSDERLERIFELVPREAFLGPGPWQINVNRRYLESPNADPVFVYQNVLVALDAAKGINNGEPFLHAGWIGAVAPKADDNVSHIGAGTGYCTALLSMLTLPHGSVHAFEIDADLALRARKCLEPFPGVAVRHGDATSLQVPDSDVIYVNAGVVVPPVAWLKALKPGGRLIFPWNPVADIGLTMLVTRTDTAILAKPLMPAWFIPCVGASDGSLCLKAPGIAEARTIRSLWLTANRKPDETAVAIFPDLWFSSSQLSDAAINL